MTMIKPSFIESRFYTIFHLEPDRPRYYEFVVMLAKSIFYELGLEDKADELDQLVYEHIEEPLRAQFGIVVYVYDKARYSGKALNRLYVKVGDGIDARVITFFEIKVELDYIKDWCYDEVMQLTGMVRFTQPHQLMQG